MPSASVEACAAGGRDGVTWRRADRRHRLGDVDRLVQVLVNLLANAVKFSSPGRRSTSPKEHDRQDVLFTVATTAGASRPTSSSGSSSASSRSRPRTPVSRGARGWDWRSAVRSSASTAGRSGPRAPTAARRCRSPCRPRPGLASRSGPREPGRALLEERRPTLGGVAARPRRRRAVSTSSTTPGVEAAALDGELVGGDRQRGELGESAAHARAAARSPRRWTTPAACSRSAS